MVSSLPTCHVDVVTSPCCCCCCRFNAVLPAILPLLLVQAWVFGFSAQVKRIVLDKEQRVKETLAVMGLGRGVQWAGWFTDCFLTMFLTSIVLASVLVVSPPVVQ